MRDNERAPSAVRKVLVHIIFLFDEKKKRHVSSPWDNSLPPALAGESRRWRGGREWGLARPRARSPCVRCVWGGLTRPSLPVPRAVPTQREWAVHLPPPPLGPSSERRRGGWWARRRAIVCWQWPLRARSGNRRVGWPFTSPGAVGPPITRVTPRPSKIDCVCH